MMTICFKAHSQTPLKMANCVLQSLSRNAAHARRILSCISALVVGSCSKIAFFKYPHKEKSDGEVWDQEASHFTGPPQPIHLILEFLLKNAVIMSMKCGALLSC